MKNFTLLLIFMVVASATFAQIPNANFETWSKPSGASFQDPDSWQTSNDMLKANASDSVNVFKDSLTGYVTNSAKLITTSVNFGGGIIEAISGGMVTGNMALNFAPTPHIDFTGGFAYTGRPGSLQGYYTYVPGSGGADSCQITVILFKRNGATRDTVAVGRFYEKNTVASYALFTDYLTYRSAYAASGSPDSALVIVLSSSAEIGLAGTTLTVDNLSFAGTAGVNEVSKENYISSFPNPASDVIYLNALPGQFKTAAIYDITGRQVKTVIVTGNSINVHDITSGNYIMMLNDKKGGAFKSLISISH